MKHTAVSLQKSFFYSEKYSLLYSFLSTFMDTRSEVFLKSINNLQKQRSVYVRGLKGVGICVDMFWNISWLQWEKHVTKTEESESVRAGVTDPPSSL